MKFGIPSQWDHDPYCIKAQACIDDLEDRWLRFSDGICYFYTAVSRRCQLGCRRLGADTTRGKRAHFSGSLSEFPEPAQRIVLISFWS